jgi:hypothetical protein
VAGRQAQGPEADRLLTLEHAGSGTPALARDDAVETATSHPCAVLELPPAWPLGCGADNVPAFCLVCFHREEEEEEQLQEVPLRRSVSEVGSGGRGQASLHQDPAGPGRAAVSLCPPTSTFLLRLSAHLVITTAFSPSLPLWLQSDLPVPSHCGHVPPLLTSLCGSPLPQDKVNTRIQGLHD